MSQTVIKTNDPKAVKKWSGLLAVDTVEKSYWEQKFIGTDENNIIQRQTDLESDAGDSVTFDLSIQLRDTPTFGDARLEGKEEALKFFSDQVNIDQVRKSVSAGGKMTNKRTKHNLRDVAKGRLSDYFARLMDEYIFAYMSGSRGINEDSIMPIGWTGFAANPLQAPDAAHVMYGGAATSKATLAATDKMTRLVIERADTKAKMIQAINPDATNLWPVTMNGEERFVMVMNPYQEHDLRTDMGASNWLDVQKAAAAAEGKNNPIFRGNLGMIKNTVLHSHRNVIRFNDYGVGGNVLAARALFLGRQAGIIAYGTKATGGTKFSWKETLKDYDNELGIAGGTIMGMKKTQFNGTDFGVISVDTAAANPG